MDKLAVLLDFDGTIDERNVFLALLDEFAIGDWRQYFDMARRGDITFREALEKEFECLPSDREKLTEFVLREARVRDGLQQLVRYCNREGYPLEVVSGGLDFYIEPIMESQGLGHIVRNCSVASFESGNRPKVFYNGAQRACDVSGTCKCHHVERFKSQGYTVVLVGDGTSDFCASNRVDHVFARRDLLEYCQGKGIPHSPFETFHEVVEGLKGMAAVS